MSDLASTAPHPAAPPVSAIGSRSREHPIEVRTRVELVNMAFRGFAAATYASAATALAVSLVLHTQEPAALVWGWCGFILIIYSYQLWLTYRFKAAAPTPEQSPSWGFRFIVSSTLSGVAWGATVWLFPILHHGGAFSIGHVLILAGITAGSSRLLLPLRKGSMVFLFMVMAPLAARFFADGDRVGLALGICVLFFTLYIASATLRNHQTLSEALVMRFERETLAKELTAENVRRSSREVELQEARERAESASRAKGEFLATISHEIRTPMNGVLGMLGIVRDTPLSVEQRSYLKTAADSAEALLLLLNDVLDFSKIEAGRLDLEHAPFSPVTVAKAISDLMLARVRDKGLQFELHLGENLPSAILGDSPRIRQILVNLIGNAIKFTERGRVDLTVNCVERVANKATLHFTVTDTGIGIDSAALERLFKPFTQADTSMSRRYGGTGLGLAISMRLAQAMGGAIQVQSALNQGSTFRLILPCRLPNVTAIPFPSSEVRFVTPKLSGRVLVVEDDAVNQQVIDLFLKKMNLNATFALDGESAITAATSASFDLILMDCQLPGIDGLEATRKIREKLDGKPVKIIALTANASTHVREACFSAGMDDFLSKPVRFEILANLLQQNLPGLSESS